METASTTASARAELDERGVLTVTLARPRHRNPLDAGVFEVLRDSFGRRAHERDVRVVVVRGEGDHFCAGLDRALLAGLAEAGGIDQGSGEALQQTLLAVETCPRPTLAVVQGACVGGGVELILACDFRVASSDAYFSLMEMRRPSLEECAARWTNRCAEAPPLAVAAAKRIMQRDPGGADAEQSLAAALRENLDTLLRSADFREGLGAAMERRPPHFRGE